MRRLLSFRRAADRGKGREALDPVGSALRFLDEMAVAAFVLDRENRVIIWNRACARLTGLEARAVIGTRDHWKGFYTNQRPCLADLALSGDADSVGAHYAAHDSRTGDGANLKAENWCDLPNGSRVYLVIDARPVHYATGAVVAVIEPLQDMTARKLAEKAIEGDGKSRSDAWS